MAKFISLSEACGNNLTKPLLINSDHIQHLQTGNKGVDTHIRLADGTRFFVKESFAAISALIEPEKILAPSNPNNVVYARSTDLIKEDSILHYHTME